MQRRGILLHIVTQETENERMLDNGDTARLRRLYYLELISRFAHHPGLIWNLGEENGPADFSPLGQTAEQQRSMADFFSTYDPYDHPVIIHTHSTSSGKEEVSKPLLGHNSLDGLSFQVDVRERVNQEVAEWLEYSNKANRPWLITMDEVGKWHTGAKTDSQDPSHDSLRHHALWGSLLAGAAGVEWYFGAKQPHNDLTSEDWRQRERLWTQTRIAAEFFREQLPYWEMKPANELVAGEEVYAMRKGEELLVLYIPSYSISASRIDLSNFVESQTFDLFWVQSRIRW